MADGQTIPQFYAGRKVFITGATGFIGKVLLWKLLQSCPLIDTIYILVRSKHGLSVEKRKAELLNNPVFDNFREIGSTRMLEKIVVMAGDIHFADFGLSSEDKECLINDVSVVFYGSALLKMDASLKEAVDVNMLGVVRAMDLMQKMKNLAAFVYLSTAYCCCDTPDVEEKLYPMKLNPHDIISFVNNLPSKVIDKVATDLIDPLPNSYIFTKRLSELLLVEYAGKVPLIITRPTIVVTGIKEPIPGWMDSLNGAVGVAVATGKGVLRAMWVDPSKKGDMIPVDLVANALIAIPWREVRKSNILSKIPVYNIASTEALRITWREYQVYCTSAALKYPFGVMLWYPNYDMIEKNKLLYQIKVFLYHDIPAVIIDGLLFVFRQKRFMRRVQKKISSGLKVLTYFSLHQWNFRIDNLESLWDMMTPEDKETFPLLLQKVDYVAYAESATLAMKKYVFKESIDENGIWWCRLKLNILYAIKIIVTGIFYYMLLKLSLKLVNYVFYSTSIDENVEGLEDGWSEY